MIKILLIEQDRFITEIYEKKLSEENFDVKIINDPNDNSIEEINSFQPTLILMNVLLPNTDGFKLLQQIKESSKSIVVIFSNILGDKEVVDKLIKDGADDCISFSDNTPEQTIEKIKELLSN